MDFVNVINGLGLILITFGSVVAAFSTPAPTYNKDGSVSLSGDPDKNKRIKIYKRQQRLPFAIGFIGLGAFFQLIAIIIAANIT